jgi:large subunit ribosomal protein L17
MRHHVKTKKLGRKTGPRQALFRTQMVSLINHGRIETTLAKAKELRPRIERLVTKARPGTVASHRLISAALVNPKATAKLVREIAPRYQNRAGGYTRIVKLPSRQGDAAGKALIEFV